MIGSAAKLYENRIHRFDSVGLLNDRCANHGIGVRQSNRSSYNGITGGSSPLTFAVEAKGDGGDSDASSPRLWKMSPAGSPPPETCDSHQPMSPNSRTQAIARGQRELMEMIKDLPESFYELSLRDIVDRDSSQMSPLADRDFAEADDEKRPVLMADPRERILEKKKVKKTMPKSRSFDSGGYLLKTSVFPIWFGLKRSKRKQKQKQKLFSSGSLKVVGPTPATVDAEKEWWRRKSSEESDSSEGLSSSNSGSSSRSSSRSSSTSSSFCRQGQSNKFLLGCCSFKKN